MRLILGLALIAAACTGAAPRSDQSSAITADGRAIDGDTVSIRLTGKQSYGRPIGTVDVGGKDLGETMIAAGLAVPATSYLKSDPARAQRYVVAYELAQRQQRGAHAGYFIDPAKWRRGERLSCETRSR